MEQTDILSLLRENMTKAHAPYSKFNVGSVIVSTDGKFYSGCNVENAAYPLGVCAEAGAISAMIQNGSKGIHEIYVMGAGDALVTPCGGCRQKIREFSTANTRIHICGPEGLRQSFTIEDLLPFSFGPDNLKHE
ncbi:cytidine deaminase [Kiloniella antarctica]|uniref:Cytidine deaminase n=1 Tax=Kiloniella antarctica TaxID=1550907 RepID=A0ABW5BRJ5_9PROT